MIEINKLQVKYQNKIALDIDYNLNIKQGDRIAIIGSNGSGKTTFVKALLGLVKYSGDVNMNIKNDDMAVHLQENNYTDNMKIKPIIEMILNTKIANNQALRDIIEYFEFEECLNKKFKQLSGGQKQRMTIILVLMQDSKMTFFDEVTSGLDFETRKELMEKIKDWYANKPASLCIVSHYFEELEQLVNKILIIEHSKVVDFDTPAKLFNKYCGSSIIILDNNEINNKIVENYNRILAPSHLIAVAFDNATDELQLTIKLSKDNINFKRSNNDLEIMYYNAITRGGYHE